MCHNMLLFNILATISPFGLWDVGSNWLGVFFVCSFTCTLTVRRLPFLVLTLDVRVYPVFSWVQKWWIINLVNLLKILKKMYLSCGDVVALLLNCLFLIKRRSLLFPQPASLRGPGVLIVCLDCLVSLRGCRFCWTLGYIRTLWTRSHVFLGSREEWSSNSSWLRNMDAHRLSS